MPAQNNPDDPITSTEAADPKASAHEQASGQRVTEQHDNARNADNAAATLENYAYRTGGQNLSRRELVGDLIADLHHLADREDFDLDDAIEAGCRHYSEERDSTPAVATTKSGGTDASREPGA